MWDPLTSAEFTVFAQPYFIYYPIKYLMGKGLIIFNVKLFGTGLSFLNIF